MPSLLFLFTHSLGSRKRSIKSSSANTGSASKSCALVSPAETGEQAGKWSCPLLLAVAVPWDAAGGSGALGKDPAPSPTVFLSTWGWCCPGRRWLQGAGGC